jgi:hypothetical protein
MSEAIHARTEAPEAFREFELAFAQLASASGALVELGDHGIALVAHNLLVILPDGTAVTKSGSVRLLDDTLVLESETVVFADGISVLNDITFDATGIALTHSDDKRMAAVIDLLQHAQAARTAAGFVLSQLRNALRPEQLRDRVLSEQQLAAMRDIRSHSS